MYAFKLKKSFLARLMVIMLAAATLFPFVQQERAAAEPSPPAGPQFTGPATWTKFSPADAFIRPFGMYIDGDDLYVADNGSLAGNGTVKKISITSKNVTPVSGVGLQYPIAVTKDVYGTLYATDGQVGSNSSAKTVKVLGTLGWSDLGDQSSLNLKGPLGLVSDSSGIIYVSDYDPGINDPQNTSLNYGRIYKYSTPSGWELLTDTVAQPLDMAIDSSGRMYVTTYSRTVSGVTYGGQIWRSNSDKTSWDDITLADDHPFLYSYGITNAPDGTLYVNAVPKAEPNASYIYKQLPDGKWVSISSDITGYLGIGDLTFDSQGYLYGTSLSNQSNSNYVYKYLNAVVYDANTAIGIPPADYNGYNISETATVLGNTTNLVKPSYSFGGWNTERDGSGTTYQAGDTTNPLTQSMKLYAIWNLIPTITSVTLDTTSYTLGLEQTHQTVVTAVYSNAITSPLASGVQFSSSNTAVAEVDSTGLVTAKSNGQATITATYNSLTASSVVTVIVPTITTVTNDVYSYNLNIGQTHQTVVTATYSDATTVSLTSGVEFTSSNMAVAEVSATGLVTAKAAGTAVITSSYQGLQGISNVTVNAAPAYIPQPSGVEIYIDGVKQDMAKSTQAIVNGQTVTTVVVDTDKVTAKLETENNKLVTIPVTGGQVVIGQLTGNLVKTMESKDVQVQIVTDQATYTLPASLIQIDSISAQLGTNVALKDITINIQIASSTSSTADKVKSAADKANASVVGNPVEFEITATYNGKTVPISTFSSYVERMIALPAGLDPSKVTTGVIYRPDGTFYHVPTVVKQQNGKNYAFINSLTNSTYSVIFNQREFSDVSSHWSKADVNDLASRMVVQGVTDTEFRPDASITRAEFASIVLNGLGIQPAAATGQFSDVNTKEWYAGIVQASVNYNLMSGYEDGTFHPTQTITRQEAITVLARALSIAKLSATLSDAEASKILSAYTDGGQVASWAKASVASAISKKLVNGRSDKLEPTSSLTRAETAALVHRLLQTAGLIN